MLKDSPHCHDVAEALIEFAMLAGVIVVAGSRLLRHADVIVGSKFLTPGAGCPTSKTYHDTKIAIAV